MTARRTTAIRRLDDPHIGLEAGLADDDHGALKLWLRLLACSNQIGAEIRRRLRAGFGITLFAFGGWSCRDCKSVGAHYTPKARLACSAGAMPACERSRSRLRSSCCLAARYCFGQGWAR